MFKLTVRIIALCLALSACAVQAPVQQAQLQQPDTSWIERPAVYELFVRDFSPEGNFHGVIKGLDRVQKTGANVIWLMPIYPIGKEKRKGTIGSPYAVADYRGINPDYGTAQDFKRLVDAIHARGMKVILDFVPNHTAWDHAWIKSHPDRYTKNDKGEITHAVDNDGKPTDWTDVADLNYNNPDTRRAVIEDMKYWRDTFGIDGFRMDVAGFVPHEFWKDALTQLRANGPILQLAEWGDPLMHADGFHLTYGWDAYGGLKEVWKGRPASEWVLKQIADVAALPFSGRRLYFTTNHDETAWDNPPLTVFNGRTGARGAFVAMAFLPGVPLLYNGQEVESPQKLPLFEKVAIEWDQPGANQAIAFYKRVIDLARTHRAFEDNDLRPIDSNASDDVIAYRRGNILVFVNTRARGVGITPRDVELVSPIRLLGEGYRVRSNGISLDPYGFVVLELSR